MTDETDRTKTQEITDLTIHAVPNNLFLWIMTSTTRVSRVTSPQQQELEHLYDQ
jgi:hypothetical protein